MTQSHKPKPGDAALGMNSPITRRDFLGSTLLASGALLSEGLSPAQLLAMRDRSASASGYKDWNGYGGVGDYSTSNGNTMEVLLAGHKIRDGAYEKSSSTVTETGETYDCVIVGGGISGLAVRPFLLASGRVRQKNPHSRKPLHLRR